MHMIAGFSMHNCGVSDQAFSLALAVAWKVLFLEIGLDISNEQLLNGTPFQTTLSNAEYQCSAECLLMVADEMKDCKYYALSQDAGHRAGLEHLVTMIRYPSKDKNSNLRVKNFCLDIDACGKSTIEVADGIGMSLRRLQKLLTARCSGVTGDAGGGGAIQNLLLRS